MAREAERRRSQHEADEWRGRAATLRRLLEIRPGSDEAPPSVPDWVRQLDDD
jgi:hypothetical protein